MQSCIPATQHPHPMHITNFRELTVWHDSIALTKQIYDTIKGFPKDEIFALTSQIKRAMVSVPSNIAEGCGRDTIKDFVHFLHISRGSLYELETQIEISKVLDYISEEEYVTILNSISIIQRKINKLISYYKKLI